jgi:hypothetical protein
MTYNRTIISLKAFLGKTNLAIIDLIKICNLKHTDHWSKWIDDYGNILKITDDKDFAIILNTNCDNQNIDSKDLYIKTHIKHIIKNSIFSLIAISDESYFIWLLDSCNILRLYSYVGDIYMGTQPVLLSSIDALKKIIRNLDVESFREIHHIIEPTFRKEVDKAWATKLPMDEKLLTILPEILQKDLNAER